MNDTATQKTFGPGDEVGGYRILRVLGEGGMGVVYLAEHKLMGRQAAIKVLLPLYSGEPELTSRFFNEARAATSIRHPGIVEIYDFGHQPNGTAYIIMEFLEGESLDGRIKRLGTVSLGNTLNAARQIASALAAAHAKGIVHRDLKPDNIFLVPDRDMDGGERIKVLDFGIAKLSEAENTSGSVRTRTGVVMGTPAYMAPEQCKGAGDVDHRADLYSLGCIVYEMLCGRPPFIAEGAGELIAKHIYEQPVSLIALNPVVPDAVDAFVRQLLQKSAAQRPANAEQVIGELDRLIAGTGAAPTVAWSHGSAPPLLGPSRTPPPMYGTTTTSPSASGYRGEVGVPPTGPPRHMVGTVALTAPSASARRWPLLITVLVVGIGSLVGGAVVLLRSADPPPTNPVAHPDVPTPAQQPAVAASTDASPVARSAALPPARTPAPPPKVEQVTISIDSRPTGASLYLHPKDIRIGRTPYVHTMKPQDGELLFTLAMPGFDNRTLVVAANTNSEHEVVLDATPRPTRPSRRPPPARTTRPKTPTKTPPRSSPANRLNPFELQKKK